MSTRLHLCRPGTYTALSGRRVTLSAADLEACAAAYDPALHQAPLVIGHPKTDDPAYGWIADLAAEADGTLTGGPEQVAEELREAVSAGRYRKLSASFFPPANAANPAPGSWYLRHVGFLGAAEPAVKGLAPVHLAGGDDPAETDPIEIIELGAPASRDHPETESAMPDPTTATPAAPEADTVDLAAARAEIADARAEIEAERAAIAAARAEIEAERARARAAEVADFAAGVVRDHHLAPHLADTIAAVLRDPAEAVVELSAGEEGAEPERLDRDAALRRLVTQLADPANRIPQGEAAPAAATADLAAGDPDAAARAEYQRNPALQAEFSGPDTYAAYKRAEAAGRVRISTSLTPEE